MNRHNLQRMVEYLKTVREEGFCMAQYRDLDSNKSTPECDSVGCVIGWCTVLDEEKNIPRDKYGDISFGQWSKSFTGLDIDSPEWDWCFSSRWVRTDNTPCGAAKRIQWLLDNGLPENWRHQMWGDHPLCYL